MLIEIEEGVFFDTEKRWYEQSPECIQAGQDLMVSTLPETADYEPCEAGSQRLLRGVWQATTSTGTFQMEVVRTYLYPANSNAFLTKLSQDTVTVTEL